MTTETIKNEILGQCSIILQKCLVDVRDNPKYSNVVKSYGTELMQLSEANDLQAEKDFQDIVKNKIVEYMEMEKFSDKLSSNDYVRIKDHCFLAIL